MALVVDEIRGRVYAFGGDNRDRSQPADNSVWVLTYEVPDDQAAGAPQQAGVVLGVNTRNKPARWFL
jgi:hypothetical protein